MIGYIQDMIPQVCSLSDILKLRAVVAQVVQLARDFLRYVRCVCCTEILFLSGSTTTWNYSDPKCAVLDVFVLTLMLDLLSSDILSEFLELQEEDLPEAYEVSIIARRLAIYG